MFRVMIPTLTLATAGDPATNLGSIDSKAGATGENSITAGMGVGYHW